MTEDQAGNKDTILIIGDQVYAIIDGEQYPLSRAEIERAAAQANPLLGVGMGDSTSLKLEEAKLVAAAELGIANPHPFASDIQRDIDRRELIASTTYSAKDYAHIGVLLALLALETGDPLGYLIQGSVGAVAEDPKRGEIGGKLLANTRDGTSAIVIGGVRAADVLSALLGSPTSTSIPSTFAINPAAVSGLKQTLVTEGLSRTTKEVFGPLDPILGDARSNNFNLVRLEDRTPPPTAPQGWLLDPRDHQIMPGLLPGSRSRETEEGYSARIGGQITPPSWERWAPEDLGVLRTSDRLVWQDDSANAERIGGNNTPTSLATSLHNFNWGGPDEGYLDSGEPTLAESLATFNWGSPNEGYLGEAGPTISDWQASFTWEPDDLGASYALDYPPDPAPTYTWDPVDEGASYAIDYPPEPEPSYTWDDNSEYASYSI
jgi:hypothetical protein